MTPPTPNPAPRQFHALCVGINHYTQVEDNRFAVSDARALHQVLSKRLGYRSRLLLPTKWLQMSQALDRLVAEAQPGDTVLVYVAAHGVQLPRKAGDEEWLPRAVLLFPDMQPEEVRQRGEQAGEVLGLRDLTRRLAQAAPEVNWVLVWDTCRRDPAALQLPDAGVDPMAASSVLDGARDLKLNRRSAQAGPPSGVEERDHNWTVLLACRAEEKAYELGRLQRGALGYVLQRCLEQAHAAGQGLWADESLIENLDLMLKVALNLSDRTRRQRVELFRAHPATCLLSAKEKPQPLPPTGPLTPCRPCKLLSLGLLLLAALALLWLLWFKPPPPPCPQPPPCPECVPCVECTVCQPPPPPPPWCDPKDPTKCVLCDPRHPERCATARLHVWDGERQLFWTKGSHDRVERHTGPRPAQAADWREVWQSPDLVALRQTQALNMVVALGLASHEGDATLTGPERQRAEERRACRRARTLLSGLPDTDPLPARALVLGQYQQGERPTNDSHVERPVALVTIADRHPEMSDTALALEIQHAISTRWAQRLGRYSLSHEAKLERKEALNCGP